MNHAPTVAPTVSPEDGWAVYVSAESQNVRMNGADIVDILLRVLPRRAVQVGAAVLMTAIALQLPAATQLLLWYGQERVQPIVDGLLDSLPPATTTEPGQRPVSEEVK